MGGYMPVAGRGCQMRVAHGEFLDHDARARGSLNADRRLVKLIGKRVGACLRHQRSKGLVRSMQGNGPHLLWEIAR